MIRLQQYSPKVYSNQSRDFQLLERLFDIVLNDVKTNADMIYDIPSAENAGSKMIDLLALTLGFHSKHDYNVKQLSSLCSSFATILRNKGSKQAIQLAGDTLLNSEGITEEFNVYYDEDNHKLQLLVPPGLSDINLLKDILTYILPAGISCEIVRTVNIDTGTDGMTQVGIGNTVTVHKHNGNAAIRDYKTSFIIPSVKTNPEVLEKLDEATYIKNSTIVKQNKQ